MANIDLYPHQTTALGKMRNGTILTGGVGSGKSITAIAYYYLNSANGGLKLNGEGDMTPMKTPKDLYVITTARKREELDWEKEAARFGITTDRSIHPDGIRIRVDSWNNIAKYLEVKDAFFIFDEQRVVGSGAWAKSFIEIAKSNEWIILSATPGDTWMDYIPVFVANGFYKNRTDFIRQHVVWKYNSKFQTVDRYVEQGRLQKLRRQILIPMPMERHTVRNMHEITTKYDPELFKRVYKDRWNIYKEEPIRDVAELFSVMRRVVNTDPTRAIAVKKLWRKHQRLIVFYNFDYELEILRNLAEELHAPYAEWNGHKHQQVPDDDAWLYFVQYTAGSEAWNCITTDTMVMYSLNYSYKITEQSYGRIDRLNTPFTDLHYYTLRSDAMIDKAIAKSLSAKKTFNEKDFLKGSYA